MRAEAGVSRLKILTSRIVSVDPQTGSLKEPFDQDRTIEVSKRSGRILCIRPTTDTDLKLLDVDNARELEFQSQPQYGSQVDDVVDLRGKTVLPGFIDTHVHCEFTFDEFHIYCELTCRVLVPSFFTSLCRY
jgi:cytosine/adenosine deaminase-related metal-dependent hydrolase